jgi:RNA polymerase sigma-70 factor (ECF subfamily)
MVACLGALAPLLRQGVRRGFARSGFGNGDVEDVVQEALLAIHPKRQTWDDREAIIPWVTAIARRKLIDSLRRGRHLESPIDDLIEVLAAEAATEGLSSREAERALSVLNGRHRDVVHAISIEGMNIREAATHLRISGGAARVALHRGLSTLAAAYMGWDR